MDSLLSAAKEMNDRINEAQGKIETITMKVQAVAESVLCYVSKEGVMISLDDLLTEDDMVVLKGYVNAFLFEKIAEPKAFLERILGFQNLDEEDAKEEVQEAPIIERKVTDDDMAKAMAQGCTAADLAMQFGIKESTAKTYINKWKRDKTLSRSKGAARGN